MGVPSVNKLEPMDDVTSKLDPNLIPKATEFGSCDKQMLDMDNNTIIKDVTFFIASFL